MFKKNTVIIFLLINILGCTQSQPTNTQLAKNLEPNPQSTIVFMKPLKGSIIQKFTESNKGIDISGFVGEPVVAAASGTVVFSSNSLREYGNLIIIKHDNTFLTAYAFNKTLLVKVGNSVIKGQKIAEVGDYAGTPKLHFEIRVNGKAVDPERYLSELPPTTLISSGAEPSKSASMDDYKKKCSDLGFKAGTEGFGKCVLQLSK